MSDQKDSHLSQKAQEAQESSKASQSPETPEVQEGRIRLQLGGVTLKPEVAKEPLEHAKLQETSQTSGPQDIPVDALQALAASEQRKLLDDLARAAAGLEAEPDSDFTSAPDHSGRLDLSSPKAREEDWQAYAEDLEAEEALVTAISDSEMRYGVKEHWPGIDYQSSAGRCLQILLSVLGWGGEGRHLVQALPHFDSVSDLPGLRAVLTRLNLTTCCEKMQCATLTAEKLPCLHIAEDGTLSVLLSIDPIRGTLTRFNGGTGEEEEWPIPKDRQNLLHVKPFDLEGYNKKIQSFGWVTQAAAAFKKLFFNLFLINFGINFAALAVPIFIMSIYGYVIPSKALDSLAMFMVGIGMVIGADFALRILRSKVFAYIGARFDTALSVEVFQRLLYMPFHMVQNAPMGAQLARLRQFEKLRELFLGSLGTALLDLPFVGLFIIAIAMIGGWLAAIPAVLVLCYGVLALVALPIAKRQTMQTGEAKTKKQNIMMELFLMQRDIRNVGGERIWQQRFDEAAAEFAALDFRSQHFSQKVQIISQALSMATGLLTLGLGTLAVMSGYVNIGALIAIMALIWRVLAPLQNAFLSLSRIGRLVEAIRMINNLMRMPVESNPGEVPNISRVFEGQISIKNVSFRYPKASEGAIKGINLSIQPGELVAITGPSGGGKSTLLKLLASLYRPTTGSVSYDNLDIRQIDLSELRGEVSYQPDHPTFFYGTVVQNFQLNDPEITASDTRRMMDQFNIPHDHPDLPEGINTRLRVDTLNRMPDQLKQELLLARTFCKKAVYYFLDEPASYLDFETDKKFMAHMEELRGKASVLFTTQRPSHMKMADRVIVLHEGQLILNGPPEKILPQLDAFNKSVA
ncbi:MAG: ATP-binding cassette domain-containing protein [Cohaesibacter sp.]|jgi:ABC-type bacteriocin/lantibiotic exporter with double-glycine peptidase domain|nr:ATP-binding cassette domain-containing protein [Cohaesibacter sp.]